MKDTYSFPKTLRNYIDESNNRNQMKINSNDKNIQIKKNTVTFQRPKRTIQEQQHYIGDYYTLNNTSQIINKKSKKKKSKSKSKQSHLCNALKKSLSNNFLMNHQSGSQNIIHCKSLQKLQIISNDRSEEIKNLISQKGLLIAQNQELKARLGNPTYRQQQYVQKIVQRDLQIESLKESLKRKDYKLLEIEKEYKMQIERLRKNFEIQLQRTRQEVNKIRTSKNQKQQNFVNGQMSNTQKRTSRHAIQLNSVEPTAVNAIGPEIYKIGHSKNTIYSQNPIVIHSTNNQSLSPKKQSTNNDLHQNYKTYIGQDGYERRIYYKNTGDQRVDNYKPENQILKSNYKEAYQQNNNTLSGQGTLNNTKISSYLSKENPYAQIYKYSSNQNQGYLLTDNPKIHNQNLYSKSLTFQCFNDQS